MPLRLVIYACLLAFAGWSLAIEPGQVQRRDLTLSTAQLKQPLTIAMASDLHVGAPHVGRAALRRLVERINEANPDLILLPGDFMIQGVLGGTQVAPEDFAADLAGLHARLGVFATLGNHDWHFDGPRVRRALEQVGIRVLENEALELPASGLWLAGIGDDMTGHAEPAAAFAAVPTGADVIAMLHDPANAPALPASTRVALAGHTHGGQVRLPFVGALIVPGRSAREDAYGWIPGSAVPTWVSSGVGTSILPIRFNCPPEFVVLRLANKESS